MKQDLVYKKVSIRFMDCNKRTHHVTQSNWRLVSVMGIGELGPTSLNFSINL